MACLYPMRKYIFLLIAVAVLFVLSLIHGSVAIPLRDIWAVFTGGKPEAESFRYIVLDSRLPQALTALLAGGALSVSGLLLQTAFRNPLAAPDIFGITSGASLAVALLMLAPGFAIGTTLGYLSSVVAAFIGAIAVTAVIVMFSRLVRSSVILIIIGIMTGYLCSSIITLLNFSATRDGVKNFVVWGMGNFTNVSMGQMPLFASITILAAVSTFLLAKPLNAMLLGPYYAENLGFNVRRIRNLILVVTGLLTAVVTAFCGPVSFLSLAVPHIARLILRTQNHRQLLPFTLLTGCAIALLCNVLTCIPGENGILPLNAVTPLVGAPVIIYVLLRRQ